MTLTLPSIRELSRAKQIDFILKHAPRIFHTHKKSIADLNNREWNELLQLIEFEYINKNFLENSVNLDPGNFLNYANRFNNEVKKLDLSNIDKNLLSNLFKSTILAAGMEAFSVVTKEAVNQENFLYSYIVTERVASILENVLTFKKRIDKHFPGLTDRILSIAAPAIITLVSVYSPPLGLVLQSTGIITGITNFLKTDNLEKNLEKIDQKHKEIKKDKELKEIHETASTVAEIAEILETPASELEKFNFSHQFAKSTLKEVTKNEDSKVFLKTIIDYAKTHIPTNENEVDKKFDGLHVSIQKELDKRDISPELIKPAMLSLEQDLNEAKNLVKESLKTDSTITSKAIKIFATSKKIKKNTEIIAKLITTSSRSSTENANLEKILSDKVDKEIGGKISKISGSMNAALKSNSFAKGLGLGLAIKEHIKKLSQNQTSLKKPGRSI
jgi:hypothetical protein